MARLRDRGFVYDEGKMDGQRRMKPIDIPLPGSVLRRQDHLERSIRRRQDIVHGNHYTLRVGN